MIRHTWYNINRAFLFKVNQSSSLFFSSQSKNEDPKQDSEESSKEESKRMAEFRKKLRETTPITDLGEQAELQSKKDDPLPAFPNNTNPNTGEVGGPRGPEPTRYGDWERKGRVSDF